jgi:hypothetical protein
MKVLLRHTHTAMYYARPDNWVLEASQGHNFATADDAIQHSRDQGLREVEVVLRYDHPPSEMILPVPKTGEQGAQA